MMSIRAVNATPIIRQKISVQGRYYTEHNRRSTGSGQLRDIVVSFKRLELFGLIVPTHEEFLLT